MKTFIVRLFVADDLPGVHGTVELPGDEPTPFHGVRELLLRLGARTRGRVETDSEPEEPAISESVAEVDALGG